MGSVWSAEEGCGYWFWVRVVEFIVLVECGCCDFVCPSHIPLTQRFVAGKAELQRMEFEQLRAERADQRYQARQQRLEEREAEAAAELDAQTDALADSPEQARDALAELLKRTGQKQRGDDS